MRLDHNERYLDAAAAAKLLLQQCSACGAFPNFPRVCCPRCLGELQWVEASGSGEIVTFTVIHRPHDRHRFADHVPIVMALIALDEGTETIATLVGDDRLEAMIGDRVQLADNGSWSELPQFRRR